MSAPTRDDPAAAIGSTRLTNVDADLVLTTPRVTGDRRLDSDPAMADSVVSRPESWPFFRSYTGHLV